MILLLPLAVIATGLASTPWLRVFPAGTIALPLFGAAVLAVLVPAVTARLTRRSLAASFALDAVVCLAYLLLAVLHRPAGFADLVDGFRDGPAQLISYALPLVSPRSLMVVPVTLCWLAGAVAARCLQRVATTLLPFAFWLGTFALAYAATARATLNYQHGAALADTALGAALLATLALVRIVQVQSAERLAGGGRAVLAGAVVTVLAIGAGAAGLHAGPFTGTPVAAQRVPPLTQLRPVAPLGFVAGLRPAAGEQPVPVFDVLIDRPEPGYFALVAADSYNGDSWSLDQTFRPSGGVVPADLDPALRPSGGQVTQRYVIRPGPLTAAPWMPYLQRPVRVSGTAVSVDPDSGMIVPDAPLRAGQSYLATSVTPPRMFDQLHRDALIGTSAPPVDTQLPAGTAPTLAKLTTLLSAETGVSASTPVPFLQAVARDLRANYTLSGPVSATVPSKAPATGTSRSPASDRSGGTSFADVLASILGPARSAAPEQYATLYALLARSLGVPARVVAGFHVPAKSGTQLPSARYTVTTAQAWAWVEIPVRGAGWVIADPTPTRHGGPRQQQSIGAAPTNSPTSVPTRQALVQNSAAGHAVAPPSNVPRHHGSGFPLLAVVGIGVAALVVLLLAGSALAKLVRRGRRRRHADPRARLVGAWHESLDVLAESGMSGLGTLTSSEVAARTADRYGSEPAEHAAAVGYAANVALFSTAIPIAEQDADAAWRAEQALRRSVRRALPLRLRLLAAFRYRRATRRH